MQSLSDLSEKQIYLNFLLSSQLLQQNQEKQKYQNFKKQLSNLKEHQYSKTIFDSYQIISQEINNQTPLLNFSNKKTCIYNYPSKQETQIIYVCCDYLCLKNPWICSNQQCKCIKDHYKCQMTTKQRIIKQIQNKMKKPIKQQTFKYLKGKYFLWEFMKDLISQEKQIINQIYDKTKEQSNDAPKIQNFQLSQTNFIYFFTSVNEQQQYCIQKRIFLNENIQNCHKKCKCKAKKLLFNQIQFEKIKKVLSSYNKLFDSFQYQNQSLENQYITSHMNSFERIIYYYFHDLKYQSSVIFGEVLIKFQQNFQLNGHIIHKALMYSQSTFNEKQYQKLINLKQLKIKWKQTCQQYFSSFVLGKVVQNSILFMQQKNKLKKQNTIQISIKKVQKYLKKIKQNLNQNQSSLVMNQQTIYGNQISYKHFRAYKNIFQFVKRFPIMKNIHIKSTIKSIKQEQIIKIDQQYQQNLKICLNFYQLNSQDNYITLLLKKQNRVSQVEINVHEIESINFKIIERLSKMYKIKKIKLLIYLNKQFDLSSIHQIFQITQKNKDSLSSTMKQVHTKIPKLKQIFFSKFSQRFSIYRYYQDLDFLDNFNDQIQLQLTFTQKISNFNYLKTVQNFSVVQKNNNNSIKMQKLEKIQKNLFTNLEKMMSRKYLDISDNYLIIQNFLNFFAQNKIQIQTLRYTSFQMKQSQFRKIVKIIENHPQIQNLIFNVAQDVYKLMNDQFISKIVKSLKNLKLLIFSYNEAIKGNTFIQFQKFSSLKFLALRLDSFYIKRKCFKNAIQKMFQLNYLSLQFINPKVDDEIIQAVGQICLKLEYLNVFGSQITRKGILSLKNLKKLTILNVGCCEKISGKDLIELTRYIKEIRKLNIKSLISPSIKIANKINFYPQDLIKIDKNLKYGITHLNMERCYNLRVKHLKSLKSLKAIKVQDFINQFKQNEIQQLANFVKKKNIRVYLNQKK